MMGSSVSLACKFEVESKQKRRCSVLAEVTNQTS